MANFGAALVICPYTNKTLIFYNLSLHCNNILLKDTYTTTFQMYIVYTISTITSISFSGF